MIPARGEGEGRFLEAPARGGRRRLRHRGLLGDPLGTLGCDGRCQPPMAFPEPRDRRGRGPGARRCPAQVSQRSSPWGKHRPPSLGTGGDAGWRWQVPAPWGQGAALAVPGGRCCAPLTNRVSEQVSSKGIIGLHSTLFKKKGQAIELCRLIRLS